MKLGIHRSDLTFNKNDELILIYRSAIMQNINKRRLKDGTETKIKSSFQSYIPPFLMDYYDITDTIYVYQKDNINYVTTTKPHGYKWYQTSKSIILNKTFWGNNIKQYKIMEITFNPFQIEQFSKKQGTITLKPIRGKEYV